MNVSDDFESFHHTLDIDLSCIPNDFTYHWEDLEVKSLEFGLPALTGIGLETLFRGIFPNGCLLGERPCALLTCCCYF